jgi:LacI family transcriptional regulator
MATMSAKSLPKLPAVANQPGKPLYKTVKQALIDAIDSGVFKPNERLPSTKELSRQLSVSLVTAHRALQELVSNGVLDRTQGRGTFVIDRSRRTRPRYRLGVVMQPEASMADYYHSQLIEGMRQAAAEHLAELVISRPAKDTAQPCAGYLVVNPTAEDLGHWVDSIGRDQRVFTVGARSMIDKVPSFDVDNSDLAARAVEHLVSLGHRRIAFVGGADDLCNSRDRREGFIEACEQHKLASCHDLILEAASWRLDGRERMLFKRLLNQKNRPTAVFAAGYYFALDCYESAVALGMAVPEDLSVIGVDNPPSAAYLSPGLTTFQQPLIELGHEAVNAVIDQLDRDHDDGSDHILRAELVIRRSTAAPR